MVGEDKRTVRESNVSRSADCSSSGSSIATLSPPIGTNEFISQFFEINRANINTWP